MEKKIPCVILTFAFEESKAFDPTDTDDVIQIMKAVNFGPQILEFIKLLYTDTKSTVPVKILKSHRAITSYGAEGPRPPVFVRAPQQLSLGPRLRAVAREVLAC